jgi:hypothetical protein
MRGRLNVHAPQHRSQAHVGKRSAHAGKHVVSGSRSADKDRSRSSAGFDSGTRWSRLAFVRLAGIIQSAAFKSISDQVAPRTSPDRAAVNSANSSARAPTPSCDRKRLARARPESVLSGDLSRRGCEQLN